MMELDTPGGVGGFAWRLSKTAYGHVEIHKTDSHISTGLLEDETKTRKNNDDVIRPLDLTGNSRFIEGAETPW